MPRLSRHDTVFVVTEEHNCPIHNVGDEFIIHGSKLNVDQYQGTCLFLMRTFLSMLTEKFSRSSRAVSLPTVQKVKFECDGYGCSGLLRFEYEKKSSTPQIILIEEAKKWEGNRIIQEFFPLLRETELFRSLNDNELRNLILKMEFQRHPSKYSIIKAGERGFCFCVILSGSVIIRDDSWGIVAELGPGDFFGEMSLITGEQTYPSVDSKTDVQLATLNIRAFKRVITTWHELFFFLCRIVAIRSGKNIILADRVQAIPQECRTDSLDTIFPPLPPPPPHVHSQPNSI
ncbi:MAG: cyclic nucleotide-binding domain-containing protein, partial [bacterium]|nr:cyclic nucleotide-binding domain-containing protein [bacterium]